MKVFVTGGTGFIGSHLINEFTRNNIQIKALKRNKNSKPRYPLIKNPNWITKPIDELNFEDLNDCSILIHMSAHSANIPYDNLENCIEENVIKPIVLFRRAKEAGIKKFLVAGSGFEYGESGELYDFIPVNAQLLPTQTYPASKAMSSIAFRQFAAENELILSYQRIFQVFGEGESKNRLWPSLKEAAIQNKDFDLTHGEQVRDFIYVKDLANILLKKTLELHNENKPKIVFENISGGNPMKIKDFATKWWRKFNAKGNLNIGVLQYRKGEIMRYVPK